MSIAAFPSDEAVVIGESAGILRHIVEPPVHLVLWRRSLPEALSGLSSLDWAGIEDIDEVVSAETLATLIPALVEAAGYAETGSTLACEIVALAAGFAVTMGSDRLRLRLEVVETDACRRFHADHVTARLLMPLVGPGTQWIRAGTDGPVRELRPGEVGVFKGRLWADDPLILHRSPPVATTGETRLLLALNPVVERLD